MTNDTCFPGGYEGWSGPCGETDGSCDFCGPENRDKEKEPTVFNRNYWIQRKIDKLLIREAKINAQLDTYLSINDGIVPIVFIDDVVKLKGSVASLVKRIEILAAKLDIRK